MSDIKVVKEPILEIDTERLAALYGVEFEPVSKKLINAFSETTDKLATMYSSMAHPDLPGPDAITYSFPSHVLANPLTTSQRDDINKHETQKVAEYTLSVQAEIAKVPIVENWERFRNLPQVFGELGIKATFSSLPFHEACGEWAGKQRQFWAREAFVSRLAIFGSLLNEIDLGLHVEDAFRPVGVQEGLFRRRVAWTKRDYPDWSTDQVINEAMSKTAVKPRLASHKAGAAVDARLRSLDSGQLLDFGHDYPDGGAIVYPKTPFVTAEQWLHRNIFNVASQLSGLRLYVGEDWHVSYGDNLASLNSVGEVDPTYVAQYGPVKSFDTRVESGEVTEVYTESELDEIFDF